MHINGVWEVPTMSDLAAQNKLGFEWGAVELPVFFDHACTYSDSHAFAIPNNQGKPQDPEKHAAVLEVISSIVKQGNYWATAGHIPALKSVTDSAEYQAMQPNATYAVLTANMVYDPPSKYAGVASPMFDAAGHAFTAAVNGEEEPATAVEMMKEELDALE
jgi:multiple sugar transport system substrate-binding protein